MTTITNITNETVEQITNETVEQTTNETVEQTINETVEQTINETVEQTTNETVEQTTNETVEQTTNETVENPDDESSEYFYTETTEITLDAMDLKKKLDSININPTLRVKKLSEDAILPTYGSDYSAGMDVYSAKDLIIKGGEQTLVATDISLSWDSDEYYIQVGSRSGLCYKNKVVVEAGIIDIDYMKALGVILRNHNSEDFVIKKGDRIAQIIMKRINRPIIVEVEEHPTLKSNRDGGFGSTGK